MQIRLILLFSVLAVTLLLSGCYPWRGSSLDDVTTAEKKLSEAQKAGKLDSKIINKTIDAYHFFVTYFPYDSLTPGFVVREGQLYQMDGDYNKAINTLGMVKKLYPHTKETPNAVFLTASIYEQNIKNQDSADFSYATLLFDYPDSKPAATTRNLLESKGISSEVFYKKYAGIFTKIENQNKIDSTRRSNRYHAYWKGQ